MKMLEVGLGEVGVPNQFPSEREQLIIWAFVHEVEEMVIKRNYTD